MKSQKKSKKSFEHLDSSRRSRKSNNLVTLITRPNALDTHNEQQQIEIFVAENTSNYASNAACSFKNNRFVNKLTRQMCLLFEKKLKFCELFMIFSVFVSLILYNFLLVYSLQKELNQIRIELDRLSLSANFRTNENNDTSLTSSRSPVVQYKVITA